MSYHWNQLENLDENKSLGGKDEAITKGLQYKKIQTLSSISQFLSSPQSKSPFFLVIHHSTITLLSPHHMWRSSYQVFVILQCIQHETQGCTHL